MKTLLAKWHLRRRLQLISQFRPLYDGSRDPVAIAQYQTETFNGLWLQWSRDHPFYRMWKERHALPDAISSTADLEKWPPLTKADIQDHVELVMPRGYRGPRISTGGSTGRPIELPVSGDLADRRYARLYLGRGWWGIEPLMNQVTFWGHSHLFGTGWTGRLREYRRRLADWISDTIRFNAYDMTPDRLQHHASELRRHAPEFMHGYTSCLFKLARHISETGAPTGNLSRLKAVILTSETITEADRDLVSAVFGAPVVSEYGMAEIGGIAYSRPERDGLSVFWHDVICTVPDPGAERGGLLRVTELIDQPFPLVNYATDDRVRICEQPAGGILHLATVEGRRADVLMLKDRSGAIVTLSGILVVHILKALPGVLSVQFTQTSPGRARVSLMARQALDLPTVERRFRSALLGDSIDLADDSIEFVIANDLKLTRAGKETMQIEATRNGGSGEES